MARVCGGENVGPRSLKAQLWLCTAFQVALTSVSSFGNLGQEINSGSGRPFLAWHTRTCEERLQRNALSGGLWRMDFWSHMNIVGSLGSTRGDFKVDCGKGLHMESHLSYVVAP